MSLAVDRISHGVSQNPWEHPIPGKQAVLWFAGSRVSQNWPHCFTLETVTWHQHNDTPMAQNAISYYPPSLSSSLVAPGIHGRCSKCSMPRHAAGPSSEEIKELTLHEIFFSRLQKLFKKKSTCQIKEMFYSII